MARQRQELTRPAMERMVAGALRDSINAHGPITREWTGSAAKRVVHQLRAAGLFAALEGRE